MNWGDYVDTNVEQGSSASLNTVKNTFFCPKLCGVSVRSRSAIDVITSAYSAAFLRQLVDVRLTAVVIILEVKCEMFR